MSLASTTQPALNPTQTSAPEDFFTKLEKLGTKTLNKPAEKSVARPTPTTDPSKTLNSVDLQKKRDQEHALQVQIEQRKLLARQFNQSGQVGMSPVQMQQYQAMQFKMNSESRVLNKIQSLRADQANQEMEKYKLQLQVQAKQAQLQQVQLQQAQALANNQQEVIRQNNANLAVRQLISQTPVPQHSQPQQMMEPNRIHNQTQQNHMQQNPLIRPNLQEPAQHQPSPTPTQFQSAQQNKPVQMTNEQKLLMLAQKYNVQGMKF